MGGGNEILDEIFAWRERLKDNRILVCAPGREDHLRELVAKNDLDIDVRPSLMVEGTTVYVIGRVDF